MTSTEDYIREAVRLAPGWSIGSDERGEWFIGPSPFADWDLNDSGVQPILDALAAQLVRQVDAILDKQVVTQKRWHAVCDWPGEDVICYVEGESNDRALHTIKAIIDSKVLHERG